MRDPFKNHTILIHLTENSLQVIIRLLAQSNPSGTEEGLVVQLHTELSDILKKIQSQNE
jgi:hypothetical protein